MFSQVYNSENFVFSRFVRSETNGPKKGPNLIESTVTQRQRLLTELNVKVKGGKFLKTTMVLLQWRV